MKKKIIFKRKAKRSPTAPNKYRFSSKIVKK